MNEEECRLENTGGQCSYIYGGRNIQLQLRN